MNRYAGDRYLDYDEILDFCAGLAARLPNWFRVEEVGRSRDGLPLVLVGVGEGDLADRPGFWLDGGTHATEWTGVMACVYALSRWADGLEAGDEPLRRQFHEHAAFVLPCLSPDGFVATRAGAPSLRSTLRPPRDGRLRTGLEPCDLDGDGRVRWMRWRHPAGAWIFDGDNPARYRRRTLDDDAAEAFFLCDEGRLLAWDGVRWLSAPARHGLDLNRNFPSSWAPFSMFGMDGGDYPLSEPEARATVEAFRARPRIAAGLTNHTFTGCLLTQPYRDPSPLDRGDVERMERLAKAAVDGTGYAVRRVVPDFTYDPKQPIVGVWADTMSTTFGVPGYTLEIWDPYGHAGLEVADPAGQFSHPDLELMNKMADRFWQEDPGCVAPWKPFDHPQLGPVEIGGLDGLETIRNPPARRLAAECDKAFRIADRLRRSLPRVSVTAARRGAVLEVVVENTGYLGTGALRRGEAIGASPPVRLELEVGDGVTVLDGDPARDLGWLDGWGDLPYPALPTERGPRAVARWVLDGDGPITIRWDAGRGGAGVVDVSGAGGLRAG